MERQFKASLTGTEGPVTGIIKPATFNGAAEAYRFDSIDDSLHLTIGYIDGKWQKVDGTEPYLFGWVNEMIEQIPKLHA